MAEPKRVERPLSPFMIGPYYRPQMTSMSSIMIRITGLALVVAFALIAALLLGAAISKEAFDCVNWFATSWVGWLIWIGSAWAVWYHLLGGVRHFIFDAGKGLDIPTAEKMGWAMFIGATVLTVITIIVAVA
ncbi:succinate dehydrogenase, cytochrome b556 subunit [Falsigemmobacter faecalis]|uniref:Succinate dehydrogenase cytochrome b556 subunit n=1 Tax=Falsigemmobacter faecalis TaxID=2488730 RepID=A0A3P3DLF7_9RHOB|nr:succinate dehydrogenase, cytochrome b556 subunit [Falsigemmobacter faecalis]RRH75089.1 succinate dehydrogenase, cytochrome b556 subunit [Falsigemmobacter faecalis]